MTKQEFKRSYGKARRAWRALMGMDAHFAHVQSGRAMRVGLQRALGRRWTEREMAALNAAMDYWYIPSTELQRRQAQRALDCAIEAGISEADIETRDGYFYRVAA